jgi:arylsulfatase A-like enzyme
LIVFTSDNGGYLGDPKGRNGVVTTNAPLRSGKGSLYEGGIRVPLIIKLPDSNRTQSTISERVMTTDLHETILNMAGYVSENNNQLRDGIDLNPMIKRPSSDWPIKPLFFHYPHYYETTSPVSAIIHKDFKLLHYAETDGIELYDLSKDPYETSNIAHAEEVVAEELRTLLFNWKQSVGAKEPRINPQFQPSKK